MPGEDPVEQRAADVADVQVAGRRRRKPDPHLVGAPDRPSTAESSRALGLALGHCSASSDASSRSRASDGVGQRADALDLDADLLARAASAPTPAGVPVKITSPGSRVVKEEM